MSNRKGISKEIGELADRIGPILRDSGVVEASVFGSFTRGEVHPDSDQVAPELRQGQHLHGEQIGSRQSRQMSLKERLPGCSSAPLWSGFQPMVLESPLYGIPSDVVFNLIDDDHRECPAGASYGLILTAGPQLDWWIRGRGARCPLRVVEQVAVDSRPVRNALPNRDRPSLQSMSSQRRDRRDRKREFSR